jgi:hypothetical protein
MDKLIVHHKSGEIWRYSKLTYYDQLDPSTPPNKVTTYKFDAYLNLMYGITREQYYNLIIHSDLQYSPICHKCGCSNIPSFNGLNKGYGLFCSIKCSSSDTFQSTEFRSKQSIRTRNRNIESSKLGMNPSQSIEARSKISKSISERNLKWGLEGIHPSQSDKFRSDLSDRNRKSAAAGLNPFQIRDNQISANKSSFISRCMSSNINSAHLYVGRYLSNYIKIGITTKGTDRGDINFNSIHLIKEGPPEYIADLEYKIKCRFNYSLLGSTEILPWSELTNLIKFIKEN